MRRGSLFAFVLRCADRLFDCGVRVSRQIVFLCVVKRRRSSVCTVCAVCLSAQRSSSALYVLCRAMLESGRSFDWVSASLRMLWRCYESKKRFYLCARMCIARRRFCRVHLACLLADRRIFCSSAAHVCAGSGTRVELQRFERVVCASPASLVVERVLVFFWLNEPGGANDICFSGCRSGVEEWFRCCRGYCERIVYFCVFHREQYGRDQSKLSHIISKQAQIIHIFANFVP